MKDNIAYKFFLLVNHLSNKVNNHVYLNFAQLILEQESGRYMNSQMTFYYYKIQQVIIEDILGNDENWIWEELDMEEVAKIDTNQLQEDYVNLIVLEGDKFINFNFG